MEAKISHDDDLLQEDDFIFYSLLYTSITVLFAMAVLSKFLTNEFRFGFRSILSLTILFIGEPLCQMFVKGSVGIALFGFGCLFVYSILPASHMSGNGKAVLVTGCDSGFGHALVKKLDSSGMVVFAGCLFKDGPGAIDLQNNCSDRVTVLQMDVTKEQEIEEALMLITQEVGSRGLWGLVNNAGIWYVAEIEMTSENILRKVMEVNFYGMVRTTKRFLPLLRQSKGRIVNISSVAGKVSFEGLSCYCVSKAAIESYTDTLRLEMKKWGVKVLTIQPAGFQTAALSSSTLRSRREETWTFMDSVAKQLYGRKYFDRMYENFEQTCLKCPNDLTPVIRAIKSALLSKRPLEKCSIGRGAFTFLAVTPLLPVWLADRLIHTLGSAVVELSPESLPE